MTAMFTEFVILAGTATTLVAVCLRLSIPSIVGFILTGMLVGPAGLGLVTTLPDAHSLTEVVGMLLMFTIGLEFSRQRLIDLKHQFLRLGPAQVLGTIILTVILGQLLGGRDWRVLLVWGFLLSLSSTALVLKLLHDNRDMHSPHGQNSLGILVFQDIAVIPMVVMLPFLAGGGGPSAGPGYLGALFWLGKAALVVAAAWVLGRHLLPRLLGEIVRRRSQELFFFAILFVGLVAGEAFHLAGLSASLGAFAAGLMIAESDFGNHTASVFVPLRDTLLGLFFASIGTLIDLRFIAANINSLAVVALGGFALKAVVLYAVCRLHRGSGATSLITGLTLAQVGEFSFLLAARALELGLLSREENQYFMSVSVLSMIVTPFLYGVAPWVARLSPWDIWSEVRSGSAARKVADQIVAGPGGSTDPGHNPAPGAAAGPALQPTVLIGYGIAGQNVAKALASLAVPIHVVEMNYRLIQETRHHRVRMFFGDATQAEVLHHAGLAQARLVVITVSGDVSVPRIVEVIRQERPDIEIIVRLQFVKDAQRLKVDSRTRVIVAEVETALELLAEALHFYGAEADVLRGMVAESRGLITAAVQTGPDRERHSMTLPNWSTGAMLTPHRVAPGDFVCGQTLVKLSLPQNTGASVAMVYRQGFGAAIPHGEFVIEAGDVLQLLITREAVDLTRQFLRTGNAGTSPAGSAVPVS